MDFKKLDLHSSGRGKKRFKKRWLILPLLALLIAGFIIWSSTSSNSVFNFVFNSGPDFKSTDGRVNILLLGNAGGIHDGPDLTDSIIVASYNLKTHEVALISVPRDLWLPSIKNKVNAAYVIGEKNNNGLKLAEDKLDDVLGIPIHYGIRLDFSGFSRAIDLVGGIDVNVERTFDDYEFPIAGKEDDLCDHQEKELDVSEDQARQLNIAPGKQKLLVDINGKVATDSADFACRFEHLHFNKGMTHMNGEIALKYVRSRHALGPEGSDFARSRRQQLVLQAFREKAFSLETLFNPKKIAGLFDTFGKSFETDIPSNQFLEFYNLAKKVEKTDSFVLGDLGNGKSLFINPPPTNYGGAWVLIPPNEDFTSVATFVHNNLNGVEEASSSANRSIIQ